MFVILSSAVSYTKTEIIFIPIELITLEILAKLIVLIMSHLF